MDPIIILKSLPATLTTSEICELLGRIVTQPNIESSESNTHAEVELILELARMQYENHELLPLVYQRQLTVYLKTAITQNMMSTDILEGIVGITVNFGLQDALEFIKGYDFKNKKLSDFLINELKGIPEDISDPYRDEF